MKLSEFRQNIEINRNYYDDTHENGKKIKDLELILDVLKKINSSLVLEDVLKLVLEHAIKITESERGFVVLKNEMSDQLEFKLGLDNSGSQLPEHYFNISTTVIDDVFHTGQSKFIEGAQTDTDNYPSKSILRLALQTIICSPLIVDSKKIGVIYVDSKFLHKIKNRQTTYTFEILAGQAAVAIRNAQLFEESKKAQDIAESSDKLKSDFLAQISHEIRTPINAMLSFSNLIRGEVTETVPEDIMVGFDMIESGGRRLIRTIDLILNMSEVQSGTYIKTMTEVDIHTSVLKPLFKEFTNIAKGRGLELELNDYVSRNTKIICDSHTVTQIFINLIDNAIKYTNEGKVSINILTDENSNLCIEVKDTGIGISKSYLPMLFKPFTQEETGYTRKYEGTGLGLALVKSYAEINNAEIKVESEKGVGTSFMVSFMR